MPYIRTKKINGNDYAYLVESVNTEKGPRQKVKQYLGRIYNLEQKINVENSLVSNTILDFVLNELKKLGFKEKENKYTYKTFIFSNDHFSLTRKTKSKTQKEAIISLNNGYLCTFTLQRIINFKKSKDFNKDAYFLAKYFLEAGLSISKDNFVKFYQNLK